MRRLSGWSRDQVLTYNLRDGGTAVTIFEGTVQGDRVTKARELVARAVAETDRRCTIVEPGCGAADISGPFSGEHTVWGMDVVPAAIDVARGRFPQGIWELCEADDPAVEPVDCDVLVLCEFLEHITDPIGFVERWLPHARYAVIGHPLVGAGHDPEPGHVWAYEDRDYAGWFAVGGHDLVEAWAFPMGPYPRMVIGWSRRL